MILVKVLEKKGVIQLFGAALFVSPFFNTIMTMSLLATSEKKWTSEMFFRILSIETMAIKFLYVTGIAISILMFTGRKSAWKFFLFLLGGHILHQILNLGQNIRSNWASGLFFVINVTVFLFIADQLVWKQKRANENGEDSDQVEAEEPSVQFPLPTAPSPVMASPLVQQQPVTATQSISVAKPGSRPQSASKKVMIHFQGFGPWAKLMSISKNGIHVRSLSQPPFEIGSREIEVQMKNGPTLRTRLSHQMDQDFFFEYTQLSQEEIQQLNQWLKQQAA